MTQSRQTSYADVRRRDLDVHDWVYLRISPMKGVMRFRKKGKLSPCYVGPYEILRRVGKIAYELELPNELASVRSSDMLTELRHVNEANAKRGVTPSLA
ncbi:hypothetical protein MTR67_018857 [Solanum verrucosum]|uniref:Tf2-1-like SH3-like domain-containing protein n=1 Tax=Solanum verrucosum TaxID=315347 RepID=A0AAF0QMJ7_SOLVR|nr:hypothetical protein MTR67_018857 [Solanum verrucosum]